MSSPRAPQRAQPHALKPPKTYPKGVKKLTRVTFSDRTLFFTYPRGTGTQRAAHGFVQPEHVPLFKGDAAWFEMEQVQAKPWPYLRAVRQVEPPADA